MKKYILLILVVFLLFLTAGCKKRSELRKTGFYLGQVFEAKVNVHGEKDDTKRIERNLNEAFNEVRKIDSYLNELSPVSEISALNTRAGTVWVDVSPQVYNLTKKCLLGAALTEGFFDITWTPLTSLFERNRLPTYKTISAKQSEIGYLLVQLDKNYNKIKFSSSSVKVDYSQVEKGFAIDTIVQKLENNKGIKKFTVKVGATCYYFGKHSDVFKSEEDESRFKKVIIENKAVSVVSSEDKYYKNSLKWSKYLPVTVTGEDIISVTVVAPNAFTAEVLASAFYFMGTEKTIELLSSMKANIEDKSLYNVIFRINAEEGLTTVSTF